MPAHRALNPGWTRGVRAIRVMHRDRILSLDDILAVLPMSRGTFYRRYYPGLRDKRMHGTCLFRAGDLYDLLYAEMNP